MRTEAALTLVPPPPRLLPFQFVLTEMYYDGFHRSFCDDDDDLDIIQESDSIFAFETPETFKLENLRTKRGEGLSVSGTSSRLASRFSSSLCVCVCVPGSLLANLNHNNLKYGAESSRSPSFLQGSMTPLTSSPHKNVGPEKMILLVCNRACSGHQGKR